MKTIFLKLLFSSLLFCNWLTINGQELYRPMLDSAAVKNKKGETRINHKTEAKSLGFSKDNVSEDSIITAWNAKGENDWYNAFIEESRKNSRRIWESTPNHHLIIQGLQNSKSGTVYTDILEDNFGPTLVTLGASINTDKNDSTADLQTLITNGGNGVLKSTTPLLIWNPTKYKTTPYLGLYTKSSLFFTFPQLGSSITDPQFGGLSALEIQFSVVGEKKQIGLFSRVAVQGVWGSNLWRDEVFKNNKDAFSYGIWAFGLMLTDRYVLSYTNSFNIFGAEVLDKFKPQLSLSANF